MPEVVVIANEQKYPELKEALEDLPIKVWAGSDAIAQVVQSEPIDMVLTAMVGYAGLKPTIAAIKAGKAIALANKETLVVAGELITALAVERKRQVTETFHIRLLESKRRILSEVQTGCFTVQPLGI